MESDQKNPPLTIATTRLLNSQTNGSQGVLVGGMTIRRPGDRSKLRLSGIHTLGYVVAGTGRFLANGNWYDLHPGFVFQRLPDYECELECNTHPIWKHYWIRLDTKLSTRLLELGILKHQSAWEVGTNPRYVQLFTTFLTKLKNADEVQLPQLYLEAIELVRMFSLSGIASVGDDLVSQMKDLIRQNLASRMELEELFAEIPASYSKLRRLFRASTGISPGAYRIRCRIEKACDLLAEGQFQVSEIAYRLGYPNPFVFSAQFKQITGQTPTYFGDL